MNIALDLGTSKLRSLRRDGGELIGRSVPAAFAVVADEPPVRELLTRAEIDFAVGDGELILVGDDAVRHAAALRTSLLRLMPGGAVPADDPLVRQIVAALVESLLPESSIPGELCSLVLPDAALSDRASREFISRLVWMRGNEPVLVTSTHAVALAALAGDSFTGLSLSFGAAGCSIGLTVRSQEFVHAAVPGGTDAIDARVAAAEQSVTHDAAGRRFLDAGPVRRRREMLRESLVAPMSDFGRQVARSYRESIESLLSMFADRLAAREIVDLGGPLPLVCAGGGTQAAAFGELVTELVATTGLPLEVGPVRVLSADEYLVARGALIHAELEAACAAA